jgi:ribonuclease G
MIINVGSHESRIAILEEGKLVEILAEFAENERMVGNVYKGTTAAVLPGMQAAFVDIGHDKSAFLHISDMPGSPGSMVDLDEETLEEVDIRTNPRGRTIVPIEELVQKGQDILVQVKKEPIGTKGPRVTAVPSLAGRFMVLVPNGEKIGVSRKITNWAEKRRLKDITRDLKPDGYGIIVRTEASGKGDRELGRDLKRLLGTWSQIQKQVQKTDAPFLIHKEMGMTTSLIRDLFTNDVDRLVVDSKREYKQILNYLKTTSPHLRDQVEYYKDKAPIFDAFGIEDEIEKCSDRKVWLKGGSYLVLDHTEALVAIDVNSGRYVGRTNQEETVLKINLEAAREIARQLRLRDIGGIIVIDFIDMDERKNRQKVMAALEDALKADKAPSKVLSFNEFGLIAITRKRVRQSLERTLCQPCPYCNNSGLVKSPATVCNEILAEAKKLSSQLEREQVTLRVNPDVARVLKSRDNTFLQEIEEFTQKDVIVRNDPSLHMESFDFH